MAIEEILLGTAKWGWSIQRDVCFGLLDLFYERGGRRLDAASNYPINGRSDSRYLSEAIISEWIKAHGVSNLNIIYKIGSISNERVPANDLSASFISAEHERASSIFGENPLRLMIHWDNRDDTSEIVSSLTKLLEEDATRIGLSGIKFPESYAAALREIGFKGSIELEAKCNYLNLSSLEHYRPLLSLKSDIIAYGIGARGYDIAAADRESRDLSKESVRFTENRQKRATELQLRLKVSSYQLAMLFCHLHPGISSYIIAPSNYQQMEEVLTLATGAHTYRLSLSDFMGYD